MFLRRSGVGGGLTVPLSQVLPQLQIGALKEMTWISKKRSGGDCGNGAVKYVAASTRSCVMEHGRERRICVRFLGVKAAPEKFHKAMVPLTNYR